MTKKLIIFRYQELFNILKEIKENFEFKLEFCDKERELQNLENNEKNSNYKCLSFYKDSNRGGFLLDRFLSGYSSYVMNLNVSDIDEKALKVLKNSS